MLRVKVPEMPVIEGKTVPPGDEPAPGAEDAVTDLSATHGVGNHVTACTHNPIGIKGVGEIGLVPTAGAVAAALPALDGEWRTTLPMRR